MLFYTNRYQDIKNAAPRKFLMKSSSFIFLSGFTLGLYMSVLRRMMANAKMKMVSGFWNCLTNTGLQTQYRWLRKQETCYCCRVKQRSEKAVSEHNKTD